MKILYKKERESMYCKSSDVTKQISRVAEAHKFFKIFSNSKNKHLIIVTNGYKAECLTCIVSKTSTSNCKPSITNTNLNFLQYHKPYVSHNLFM